MNYTELFKNDLLPLMQKYGFVYLNGVFFRAVGDIMMAVSCPEDSLEEIWCAVFPVWEADSVVGVSTRVTDLSEDRSWVREFVLSNRPTFTEDAGSTAMGAEDIEIADYRLARIRLGIFVLPDLAEVHDFCSYTEWRSGEYKMTKRDFTPHEMVMRSYIDGNFEYAERYLFRLCRNTSESEEAVRERFSVLCESEKNDDCSWIEQYAKEKREMLLPYFVSAFPEAFK